VTFFGNRDKARQDGLDLIRSLSEQISRLEGQVNDLTRQKDRTAELRQLEDRLETVKREKARHDEENDRKIRETEHRVGLLRKQQELDVANAKRETELEIREGNLSREQQSFEERMEFQDKLRRDEAARTHELMQAVLERLPNIQATFTRTEGGSGRRSRALRAGTSREEAED